MTNGRSCTPAAILRALAGGEFSLDYQRIRHLPGARSDRPLHAERVEALARWRRPGTGVIGPDVFLPAVVGAGLGREFTVHVLALAVEQCRLWAREGHDVGVAVNVWPEVLVEPRFLDDVARVLEHGLDPSQLTLEVIEHDGRLDSDAASRCTHQLAAWGVRLSLDDFGIAGASLERLQAVPFDEIKIDRRFVARITTDRTSRAIVRFAVKLARFLEVDAVGEGVEDDLTLDALVGFGADAAQGYAIHRPSPAGSMVFRPAA